VPDLVFFAQFLAHLPVWSREVEVLIG
jgi:hypothetical protein